MLKLNKDNYHSTEANQRYMSCSLFKSFLPQYGGCEARSIAILSGEWEEQDKDAFILGGYVHAWSEGKLPEYMAKNPGLCKKDGTLYAKYEIADKMIETLRNDPLITKAREGEKEVIMTGELFGMPWKCMIDIYNPALRTFTDIKTCREIGRKYFNETTRQWQNFIEYYGYDWQMAIYAEIERQNRGEVDYFKPHIIAVSKEDPPDKMLIHFGTEFIEETLTEIGLFASGVKAVWEGQREPVRCEKCDYCRATKVLTKTIYYKDICPT